MPRGARRPLRGPVSVCGRMSLGVVRFLGFPPLPHALQSVTRRRFGDTAFTTMRMFGRSGIRRRPSHPRRRFRGSGVVLRPARPRTGAGRREAPPHRRARRHRARPRPPSLRPTPASTSSALSFSRRPAAIEHVPWLPKARGAQGNAGTSAAACSVLAIGRRRRKLNVAFVIVTQRARAQISRSVRGVAGRCQAGSCQPPVERSARCGGDCPGSGGV